jgi:hypothetical protein
LQPVRLQASCSVPSKRQKTIVQSCIMDNNLDSGILPFALKPLVLYTLHYCRPYHCFCYILPTVLKIASEHYCCQLIGCQVATMRDVCLEMCTCLHGSPLVGVAQQDIFKKRTTPIQLLVKCIYFALPCLSLAAVLLSSIHSPILGDTPLMKALHKWLSG